MAEMTKAGLRVRTCRLPLGYECPTRAGRGRCISSAVGHLASYPESARSTAVTRRLSGPGFVLGDPGLPMFSTQPPMPPTRNGRWSTHDDLSGDDEVVGMTAGT